MIVSFTSSAQAEIREIERYIAEDKPIVARRFSDDIVDACVSLASAPYRGTIVTTIRGVQVRRLVHRPYLIVYSISGDAVRIHRVVHGARSPRALLKGLDLS